MFAEGHDRRGNTIFERSASGLGINASRRTAILIFSRGPVMGFNDLVQKQNSRLGNRIVQQSFKWNFQKHQ
jgi:hypothetical protein